LVTLLYIATSLVLFNILLLRGQLHVSSIAQLTAYTDVDWAGYLVTRRSTFSAEAEYCGVVNVVAENDWI
nr:hypothetical protein [Tanacetum cinerariifolium]